MDVAEATEANRFGKYTLVAKLATGGMAEIFLARLLSHGGFDKLVCIKRILPRLANDPQLVAMFLDEARVVARISHPNVCQVFELGEIGGQYYIAMEYLAGVPLNAFRRNEMYPGLTHPRLVAGFGMQACEGLHHAHQLRRPDGSPLDVVHRDISAQNLFVTVDGVVKVLDFGIAKVQDQSVRTSTGTVKGTYCYMSPEQLRNERVDRRCDIWALGAVLWEILAKRHLFKRDTEYLSFQAITTEPIPDIRDVRPDIPPGLAAVIAQALSRERDGRFPTARAFGEALGQAVAPLGGPLNVAAIADEVEHAFEPVLRKQRNLLVRAQAGDMFDLEKPEPLLGQVRVGSTPAPILESEVPLQNEVATHGLSTVLDSLDEGAPTRASSPDLHRRSSKIEAQPVSPTQTYPAAPGAWHGPESTAPPATVQIVHAHSKLPWIIALVAVGVAGAAGAALYMRQRDGAAAPPTVAASPPALAPAIAPPAGVTERRR
jgi:serine/threonine-protein kinase